MAAGDDSTGALAPPRPVGHARTLAWWLGVAAAALALQLEFSAPPAPAAPGTATIETEAFHAFLFGEVRPGADDALPPHVFRAQLEALLESGAHPVALPDVQAFLERGRPLPARPVLIAFEEAGRETIESVDPVLAELGIPALAFVSASELARGNIALVSRHRLEQMARSGRWSIGARACSAHPTDFSPAALAEARRSLEAWAGATVAAASCLAPWSEAGTTSPRWIGALDHAALPLGFVMREPAENRRDDLAWGLRLIRVRADQRDDGALARAMTAQVTRAQRYEDEFDGPGLSTAWVASGGHVRIADGSLEFSAAPGDPDGVVRLAGTERWRDVHADVDLEAPPRGQFWIYARRGAGDAFVRLGFANGEVVLQKGGVGGTRLLAAVPAPPGSMRLSLRVLGTRAHAYLDGRPIQSRPMLLPEGLDEGGVALVVWDADRIASARITRFAAEPLRRAVAVLPPEPADEDYAQLRREAPELWALSPARYRWSRGQAEEIAPTQQTLEIFARHHRLAWLPAVTVAELPAAPEWPAFREQMLRWAGTPGVDGLHLVVERGPAAPAPELAQLRRAFAALGKELSVAASPRG